MAIKLFRSGSELAELQIQMKSLRADCDWVMQQLPVMKAQLETKIDSNDTRVHEGLQAVRDDCISCIDAEELEAIIKGCRAQQQTLLDIMSQVFVKLFGPNKNKKGKSDGKARRSTRSK
jgi:hypothetical protein